jgi:hypothetical protein
VKQRGKIFATLLVLTLCLGANLYAERARHIGVNNNGDLDLTLLQSMGIRPAWEPIQFDAEARTINGSAIIPNGDRTGRTESGLNISAQALGDAVRLNVDDRSILTFANGSVSIFEPDTYQHLSAQELSFEDPISGMPISTNGAVRIIDFTEDPTSPQEEAVAESSEFDIRLARSREVNSELANSGMDYMTVDMGGVEIRLWANGAVVFDPELPMKLTQMDPAVLSDLNGAQVPVAIPDFIVANERLLFADGSTRRNLPE